MKFEYKVMRFAERDTQSKHLDTNILEQDLNKLGEQGWELVSMNTIGAGTPIAVYAVFKRPRS
ncbi:MAG: DUF4177 domain-containing protein [Gammaproteobacteria bacterium]